MCQHFLSSTSAYLWDAVSVWAEEHNWRVCCETKLDRWKSSRRYKDLKFSKQIRLSRFRSIFLSPEETRFNLLHLKIPAFNNKNIDHKFRNVKNAWMPLFTVTSNIFCGVRILSHSFWYLVCWTFVLLIQKWAKEVTAAQVGKSHLGCGTKKQALPLSSTSPLPWF